MKFEGFINGERRQVGDTALLLFPIARLLVEIGQAWSFLPGDVVFTGTPAGVGKLAPGDELLARGAGLREARWRMARDER